jgi:serine/threonine protein kinase
VSLDDLSPGSVFAGDFVIERAYRQSALGAMYVVTQKSTDKERALIIPRHTLRGEAAKTFLDEARAASTLPSAHIVQAIDLGIDEASGRPWVVIEVLKGEELGSWFSKRVPLEDGELDEFFVQLCDPLAEAHELGLVHRDVRPLNIFVGEPDREGEPFLLKVRGFGMFRLLVGAPNRPKRTSWSAPELLRGDPPTPSTDVWSLGLLAYHLLTGKTYFGVDPAEPTIDPALAKAILEAPLPRASERALEQGVAERLPRGFDEWFSTCLARDPRARYLNAREARTALHHVLRPNPSLRPPPMPEEPAAVVNSEVAREPVKQERSRAWLAIGAVLAVAIAGAAFVYPRNTTTPTARAPEPSTRLSSVDTNAVPVPPPVASPTPSIETSAPAPSSSSDLPPFDVNVAKQTLNTVGYQKCGVTKPGKVVVTFSAKGTVAAVSIAEGGYDGPTRECLDRVFRYVTIPAFRGVRQSMFVNLAAK